MAELTAHFYLLPLDRKDNRRGPAGLHWRGNLAAPISRWSLKPFGDLDVGLVASERALSQPDAFDFQADARGQLPGYLRAWGLESKWAAAAGSERELLARVTGLALAHQARIDHPAQWLARPVHFGFHTLPAFDGAAYARALAYEAAHRWDWLGYPVEERYGAPHYRLPSGRLVPAMMGGALPHTDSFTAADGLELHIYNANWVQVRGNSLTTLSNSVYAGTNSDSIYGWQGDTFGNDQSSTVTIVAVANGQYLGPAVRCDTGVGAHHGNYNLSAAPDDTEYFVSYDAGGTVGTEIASGGAVFAVSDVVKFQIVGTTLTPQIGGVTTGLGAHTDATWASGTAGVYAVGSGGSTASRLDSFVGDNVGGAPTAKLFRPANLSAGAGGPFFANPVN